MGKHYWSMVTYGQFVNWLKAGTFEAALYLTVGFVSMSVQVGGLMVLFDCLSGWLVGLQTVAFKALQWSLQGNPASSEQTFIEAQKYKQMQPVHCCSMTLHSLRQVFLEAFDNAHWRKALK